MATIAWLVPGLLEGSGGHRTILQHADHLQRSGHECILYMENKGAESSHRLKNEIKRIFGFEFPDVRSSWSDIEPADMVFATIWYSARVVSALPFPCIKCYFVQDYEAWFNPMGDGFLLAENSYCYGLHPITIGRWLPAKLNQQHRVAANYFDFCADLNIYKPLPAVEKERAICFIYQPEKPRRCARIGLEALGIVKRHLPDVTIYLYGSREKQNIWFEHTNLGLVDLKSCNELYNRCQAGLCISASNPSRIPFEMMAAGLPVVEIHRENTLYDFPDDAMLLCEQTPEAIATGLMELLSSSDKAAAMGKRGIEFMKARPIDQGLSQFLDTVTELLAGDPVTPTEPTPLYLQGAVKADLQLCPADKRSSQAHDIGRLAFLPPFPRKIARFIYHRLRRALP